MELGIGRLRGQRPPHQADTLTELTLLAANLCQPIKRLRVRRIALQDLTITRDRRSPRTALLERGGFRHHRRNHGVSPHRHAPPVEAHQSRHMVR